MLKLIEQELAAAEQQLNGLDEIPPDFLPKLFRRVPLEVFGAIQIDRPAEFPRLMSALPLMPSTEIQQNWTGNHGHTLLAQSVDFVQSIVYAYQSSSTVPLERARILDFGCGWGRLTRLLYKFTPYDQIWGVDPWDKSIEICRDCGLKNPLAVSDYLPRDLPVGDTRFDLVIAFSVFTHLSAKAARMAAKTLAKYLEPGGLIALTIRPVEYWNHHDFEFHRLDPATWRERMYSDHSEGGFAFIPHRRDPIEGDVTYGDTSMTLAWLEQNFEGLAIRAVEWNRSDGLQVIVILGHA